jgi:hypothetical protein
MIQTFTIRHEADPLAETAARMLASSPGDVAMILAALAQGTYEGDQAAVDIAWVVWGLPPFLSHPILIWMRNEVVHPKPERLGFKQLQDRAHDMAVEQIRADDALCDCVDCFSLLKDEIFEQLQWEQERDGE